MLITKKDLDAIVMWCINSFTLKGLPGLPGLAGFAGSKGTHVSSSLFILR